MTVGNLYGGMSDSDLLTGEGQFTYSEGIDLVRNPEYMQLQRKPAGFSTSSLMLCACDDFTSGVNYDFVMAGNSGKIYYSNGTLLGTLPGGLKIINICKFTKYISGPVLNPVTHPCFYFFTSGGQVWYVDINGLGYSAGAWDTHFVQLTVSGAVSTTYANACVLGNQLMYFVNGQSIYSIDFYQVPIKRVTVDQDIVGFTRHGSLFRIYTKYGRIYLRDGYSATTADYYDNGFPIRYVYSNQAIDYVVAGANGDYSVLYFASGVQPQYIKRGTKSRQTQKYKFTYDIDNYGSNSTMAFINGIIFLSSYDPSGTAYFKIESYGNYYPGYPQGFFTETAVTNSAKKMVGLGFLFSSSSNGNNIYYSYEDADGAFGVAYMKYDNTQYPEDAGNYQDYVDYGVLYTKRSEEQLLSKKGDTSYQIRCKVPTGCQIKISYATNGGSSYTLLTTINPPSSNDWDGERRRMFKLPSSIRYYDISYKIELLSSNNNYSPFLYLSANTFDEIKS